MNLKSEVNEAHNEKEKAKKLLAESEKEKTNILKKISTMIDNATTQELMKMERDKLIEFIRKLLFKIS